MGEAMMADVISVAWGAPVGAVMAATVAATADSTVAAMSVGEVAGATGVWVQLAARTRTMARQRVRKARIVGKPLSPGLLSQAFNPDVQRVLIVQ
jgi:hypothetical protein